VLRASARAHSTPRRGLDRPIDRFLADEYVNRARRLLVVAMGPEKRSNPNEFERFLQDLRPGENSPGFRCASLPSVLRCKPRELVLSSPRAARPTTIASCLPRATARRRQRSRSTATARWWRFLFVPRSLPQARPRVPPATCEEAHRLASM